MFLVSIFNRLRIHLTLQTKHFYVYIMIGDKAVDLVKESSRDCNEPIAPYNHNLVELVIEEMARLNQLIQQFVSSKTANVDMSDNEYKSELVATQIRYSTLLWNKRCVLTYHYDRLEKLKKFRWQLGSILPNDIRANLSEHELEWFTQYCNNLSSYMNQLNDGKGLDLTLHRKPPKRLFIQVRCNTEYGDFELDDGNTVIFSKDSIHFLPLSQCEKLIHQGVLQQITN